MKLFKQIVAGILVATVLAAPLAAIAEDAPAQKDAPKTPEKAKPYILKTCVVSDHKLGGDMGDPYVFTYQGREIKLCCQDCKKDFDKSPSKYLKKIASAEKKAAQKKSTPPPADK